MTNDSSDLLSVESRQLNSLYAGKQSLDYYDYLDYGQGLSNKLASAQLTNRNALQQKNSQLGRLGAAASSGYGNYASYSGDEYCDNGISIALLLTALLGIAVMFYVLYTKITMGRRRRRSTDELDTLEENMNPVWFAMERFQDFVYSGLEEFENKVDQIAAGHEENSWISALYKKLSDNFSGSSDELQNGDLDGMEPPILDETWGLEDIQRIYQENNTVPEFGSDNNVESVNIMTKGDPGTDETETTNDDDLKGLFGEQKCNTKFWRCIGGVVQGGAHYLQEPGGLTNAIQKTLFKVAFHGGFGNVWNALMTIPEARKVKKCMNEKDECLSVEILKREVNATLDDSPRMIINPEFVEGLDNSDGQDQFDPEDQKKYDEAINDEENEIES